MKDNPVTVALKAMKAGTGTFDSVKEAVAAFEFASRPPPPRTLESLLDEDQADYTPVPDSFRDTVFVAMFDGTLTRAQFDELREIARKV